MSTRGLTRLGKSPFFILIKVKNKTNSVAEPVVVIHKGRNVGKTHFHQEPLLRGILESTVEKIVPAHEIQKSALKTRPVPTDYSDKLPPVRCLQLNSGDSIFALILEETDDSFLVGAGTKLVQNEDLTFTAMPISPIGVVRLFKTSVRFMSDVSSTYRHWYFRYLKAKSGGVKLLPDLIKDVVLEDIVAYTQESELERAPTPAPAAPEENSKVVTLADEYAQKGITGVSEHAFEPYSQPSNTIN